MTNYDHAARKFYDGQAANALKEHAEASMRPLWRSRDSIDRFVDIGCGNGHILLEDSRFEGLELSTGMINLAPPNIRARIHLADIVSGVGIKALEGIYNVATANYVLIEMKGEEIQKATANVNKLLRPGGIFAFTITHPLTHYAKFPGYELQCSQPWTYRQRDLPMRVNFWNGTEFENFGMQDYHNPLGVYVDALVQAGFGNIRTIDIYDQSGEVAKLNGEDLPFACTIVGEKRK